MECPYCLNKSSKVTNKRLSPNGVRRRRECLKCSKRFTTYEHVVDHEIYVIKKDGRREKFTRCKLEAGVRRAFEKRPIPTELVDKMVDKIIENIRRRGVREIKTTVIGSLVMKNLRKLDNVAYIRFASVYRDFQDINDFKVAIKTMS